MSRHPWPPYDYVCLYEHTCPYLDGLSTSWVLGQYRRADDVYHEHLQIIDSFSAALKISEDRVRVLERENEELRAKYQALHRKQFKPNRKQDEADGERGSAEGPGTAKPKKRGAPVGHPGWTRPVPTRIDRIVSVSRPSVCPHCGSDELTPENTFHEHIQEDIVVKPQTVVTKYVHEEAFCPRCNRTVMGAGADEIPNAPIVPLAKSTAGYLRYGIGISYRKVQRILEDLFGMTCVPASLVGFDNKAAKRGAAIYEDVRDKFGASEGGHAVFGEDFDGVLVRDRYAAYNGIGRDFQACLAHIITNAKDIRREHALLPQHERDAAVSLFCDHVIGLCSRACEAGQNLKSGEVLWEEAANFERQFIRELTKICKQPHRFKPAETLRTYLIGPEQKHLFTFLRIPGVPPTNNHAEQSLRHIVIFRKVCFGTRSDNGIKTHSIIPTLVQTARRQGVHPREFLHILHTADTATAQAALYNNSS